MTIEEYRKTKGGPLYYAIYHKIGSTLIRVENIKAKDREEAVSISKSLLRKALEEI